MEHSTIAAIATAPGAGGIAVVRLSGPESYAVAAKVFCPANPAKRVEDAKGYTALFGHFMEGEEAFDEGVALFFRAPHSYTGEDVVELSCHGGSAVARRLVESCIAAGAAPAAPGEYTRRAFLNGKLGLTQAEAVMDLISADGRQGAALANASLNGALAKKIGAEKDAMTALQAHLTAWVDFPEEDVPALEDAQLVSTLTAVKGELDTLIRNYDAGAVLREGVDCAIVGRPNAGKSTLLNLLAGFDRAIVTPVAGTTRDVVEQAVRLGDIRLNLFDTAGLWETEDAIEAEGIRRKAHHTAQRIQFAYQRSFCSSADAGIAGHVANGIQAHGKHRRFGTQRGSSVGRFNASVARAYYDHIVISKMIHTFPILSSMVQSAVTRQSGWKFLRGPSAGVGPCCRRQ